MIKIGLTGGLGSGKSTVGRVFAALGAPVYDTDSRCRRLMRDDPELRRAIAAHFGAGCYTPQGDLDRRRLAALLFGDPERLRLLESLAHPRVMADFERWAASRREPMVVAESAILFESGMRAHVDVAVAVAADLETRVARAMRRDDATRQQILDRVARQMPDPERERRADFVIHNNDNDFIVGQVLGIIQKLWDERTWRDTSSRA